MSSIELESFRAGTGLYAITFEDGLKVKPSDVGKVVAPFKLKSSAATIVRKVTRKGTGWLAGSVILANKGKKGDRDFEDVLLEVGGLVAGGRSTLKLTGDLGENKKGVLILKLTSVQMARITE